MDYSFETRDLWHHTRRDDWNKLRECLQSKSGKNLAKETDDTGCTVLSSLVSHSPPVDIIETLIDIHPDALFTKAARGRLPLHIACASGKSEKIIKLLTMKYPKAVTVLDEDGRIPLHHIVESACEDFKAIGASQQAPVSVVLMILFSALEGIHVIDNINNETPMDIALRMEFESEPKNRRATLVKSLLHRGLNRRRLLPKTDEFTIETPRREENSTEHKMLNSGGVPLPSLERFSSSPPHRRGSAA